MLRFYHNYTYEPLEYNVDKYKNFKGNYKLFTWGILTFGGIAYSFLFLNHYADWVKA